MTTKPNLPRSGHFPDYLRQAFIEAVDAYNESDPGGSLPRVTVQAPTRFKRKPLRVLVQPEREFDLLGLCGQLWNCSDILPRMVRDTVNELCASYHEAVDVCTYAQAATALKVRLSEEVGR